MCELRHTDRLGLHLRVALPGGVTIGSGRAELLEAIRDTGSISAGARAMAMSYKRAWDLIDGMNAAFGSPVIMTNTGGAGGGGSCLTATGGAVIATYRAIEAKAAMAAATEIGILESLLARPT